MYLVDANPYACVRADVMDEMLTVYQEDFLGPLYVGIRRGFADDAFQVFADRNIHVLHPREALEALADDVGHHPEWFD